MSPHKNARTRAVAPLLALPLVLALTAPVAAAGSDDPIPAVPSPSAVADFSHPTRIDNRFFPLVPGTKWVYEGSVTEAGETVQHTIVFTDGPPSVVGRDSGGAGLGGTIPRSLEDPRHFLAEP